MKSLLRLRSFVRPYWAQVVLALAVLVVMTIISLAVPLIILQVIDHRLSTIENADIILVVQDGRIIEEGNHSELLALGGNYFHLYSSGFEG